MQPKVSLQARVNDGTGQFPQIPADIRRRAILIPIQRKKDGRFFHLKDIIGFYARYPENGKRKVQPLGKDPVAAYAQFTQIEQDFSRIQEGLLPLNPPEPKSTPKDDRDIRGCVAEYLSELKTLGRKQASIRKYTSAINDFMNLYTRTKRSIDDIDRNDVMNYITWMRANIKRQKDGDPQHAIRNRVMHLYAFLRHFKVTPPLQRKEIKKPVKKRPWKYSEDIINLLLSKATRDQKDVIHFFVNTGFRDAETTHAQWGSIDLNAGSINVYPNTQYGWTPKDGESREQDIVLDPKFVKIMAERKQRMHAKDSDLIFPSTKHAPDIHLINIVRKAAKASGFDPTKIKLHAFRRTFGTIVARHRGIEQARIWLGHSDIETTQRYLACDEMTSEAARKIAKQMFSEIGD